VIRDALLVARFEVLRAVRTWRAVALFLLYAIAYGGAAYIFVAILHAMENSVARNLRVATTDTPGALLDRLVKSDTFRDLVLGMTGNERIVDELVSTPPLALFAMWLGLLLIPFFAASASAECISIDLQSRAIRYEALRTGRLEIVLGRFAGQLALTAMASAIAVVVTWGMGMGFMVGNDPFLLAFSLALMTTKAWMFSVPFAGLGVAASAFTASPAWARVLAIGATAGSWVAYGVARYFEGGNFWIVADLALQILPQGWLRTLWEPGLGWLLPGAVCVALGLAAVGLGHARFATRDL
jgi:Cu-processing system permease protein